VLSCSAATCEDFDLVALSINGLAHFVNCVLTEWQPRISVIDGLKDIIATEAAYKTSVIKLKRLT
jgi:hypothetical protein